ncbi:2'-5' RNA ligase family protein [Paenibacillus solani]|uniref:2'-5' RNA ligase family protein n=1 Tax=Paenibacillus solani TaxID=1705565 RepID=UPI003D2A47AE
MEEYTFAIVPSFDICEKIIAVREKYQYVSSSEPHITVKASCGISDDMKWLPACQSIISSFGNFQITVGLPNYFGNKDVLYLEIISEELIELHKGLVSVFDADEEQIKKCFELQYYKPHITIARKSRLSESAIEEIRKAISPYFRSEHVFSVSSVGLFYRENNNEKFRKKIDIEITN